MEGALERRGQFLSVGLVAAVEGCDGEMDVTRLGIITDGVTVRDQGPETHHTVCIGGNLEDQ